MKRFSAFLLALIIVCLAVPFAGVSAAEQKQLWVTHYNSSAVEGAGVIMTDPNIKFEWRISVAFSPVAGEENTYRVAKIVDYLTTNEVTTKLPVPTGGFVYQVNRGNNYAEINGGIDYTNDGVDSMILDINTWAVGDVFVIEGIDLQTQTVPTSTPNVNWYEDSYVCTATYKEFVEGENADSETVESEEPTDEPESSLVDESEDEEKDNDGSVLTIVLWSVAGVVIVAVIAAIVIIVLTKKKK